MYVATHTCVPCIVAKCPGLAGTVPEFGPMSRLCLGLPDFAALSRNPARLYKWRCGTSINSVYYRISVRISRCLVGMAVHDRPKVGVVDQNWAWSVNFRTRFARINTIFYFVPVSLLINLATMVYTRAPVAHNIYWGKPEQCPHKSLVQEKCCTYVCELVCSDMSSTCSMPMHAHTATR